MNRYKNIANVSFDGRELLLPLSVKVSRQSTPLPACSDSDIFPTSIQLGLPVVAVELRLRGIAGAEGLALGEAGTLAFTIGPAAGSQAGRSISIEQAVLHAIEVDYQQAALAVAVLRFAAASDGRQDPFSAEDNL